MNKKLSKPTLKELVYFLTSDKKEIPENFIQYQNDVKRLIDYIFEQIWQYPKLVNYFQKYNNLFNQDYKKDIISFIKWLQYIFNENQIKSFHLKSEFFNFYEALNKVKDLEKQAELEERQLVDVVSEIKVAQFLNQKINIKKVKKVSKSDTNSEEIKEKIKKAQEQKLQKIVKQKEQEISSKFLKEINEKIIKELELTLIDIFVDKNKNRFIYIFIDKDFQKKYYEEPFHAEFFISKNNSIIQNNYLVPYDKETFYKYKITNYWQFNSLRNLINKAFKNFKNNV